MKKIQVTCRRRAFPGCRPSPTDRELDECRAAYASKPERKVASFTFYRSDEFDDDAIRNIVKDMFPSVRLI